MRRKQSEKMEESKVSFQLRLDQDVHQKLKKEAAKAGISLNQLIQGICRGAAEHLVQGEPRVMPNGFVQVVPHEKCLFFGEPGVSYSEEQRETFRHEEIEPMPETKGKVWFGLDFTNRGFVRYQNR